MAGTSIQDILNTTTRWKLSDPIPPPPSGFPKIPDSVAANHDRYLSFLLGVARENPDPSVREAAVIRFKREYFADRVTDNSTWTSNQQQIDRAQYGANVSTQVRNAAIEGELACIPVTKIFKGVKIVADGARSAVYARRAATAVRTVQAASRNIPYNFGTYVAENPRLANLIGQLFRPGARLSGGALRAANAESYAGRTFDVFANKDHVTKLRNSINCVRNLLAGGRGQPALQGADREYAQRLLQEMQRIVGDAPL